MTDGLTASDVALLQQNGRSGDGMFGDSEGWWVIILFALIFGWGRNGFGGNEGGYSGGLGNDYALITDNATLERKIDGVYSGICDSTFALNNTITNGFASAQNTMTQGFAGLNTAIVTQGYENRLGQQNIGQQIASCCCDIREGISGVNYNMATNSNAISRQISDCCCDVERQIERGFADTNYNMATQNCATLQAIDKVGDRVIDYLSNEKMQTLRDENFALRLSASQQAQNAYLIDQLGYHCPQPAYVVQPPQQVTFPVGCGGVASYTTNGCGCNIN